MMIWVLVSILLSVELSGNYNLKSVAKRVGVTYILVMQCFRVGYHDICHASLFLYTALVYEENTSGMFCGIPRESIV